MKEDKIECYYCSYGTCTRNGFAQSNGGCIGFSECEGYISENQFFMDSINGTAKKDPIKNVVHNPLSKTNPNLTLGKSKKAQKREAKLEAEKNHEGSGFSLLDDPRFKDLFQGK